MGKGDRRTRRGKIYNGSHGKTRPGKPNKTGGTARVGAAASRGARGR
jgi:ribosomal small subunit protein bTHX